jgi:hypothetical protein
MNSSQKQVATLLFYFQGGGLPTVVQPRPLFQHSCRNIITVFWNMPPCGHITNLPQPPRDIRNSLLPWRWKQQVHPKRWYESIRQHGAISRKDVNVTYTSVRNTNLMHVGCNLINGGWILQMQRQDTPKHRGMTLNSWKGVLKNQGINQSINQSFFIGLCDNRSASNGNQNGWFTLTHLQSKWRLRMRVVHLGTVIIYHS